MEERELPENTCRQVFKIEGNARQKHEIKQMTGRGGKDRRRDKKVREEEEARKRYHRERRG